MNSPMDFEKVAKQLAHPTGAFGVEVALGMNHLNQFINKNTYDLLQINDSDKVLEIGLGNGKFIKNILNYGNNICYTGLDISHTMITEAKKLNDKFIKAGFVNLILADIEKMPFLKESFNKICTINTIYFWKNPTKALKEVYRILRKDGLFIISFRPYIEGQSLNFSEYGFTEYKTEEVESIIHKANFKIVEKKSQSEAPIEFNGQIHNMVSQYYLLKKTKANHS